MKKGKWVLTVVLVATAAFLLTHISFSQGDNVAKLIQDQLKNEYKPPSPLLPAGATVSPDFKKGAGPAIGSAQMVQGDAFVIHMGQTTVAYTLKKGSPLFAGDTLVTGERSRVNAKMNDKSVIGLAPVSKLVLDKSVYDPKKDERSTFLSLMWGRARFIVAKITGKKPNYQVMTPTAVCGVRGTDFAVGVTGNAHEFPTTVGKTSSRLHFISTAHAATAFVTVVVVGPNGTVTVGTSQGTVTASELNAAYAAMGAAPGAPVALPLAQVMTTLNAVAPNLAALSMPPEFD